MPRAAAGRAPRGQDGEAELCTATRPREPEREADQRARDEHPARGVGEHQRVCAEALRRHERLDRVRGHVAVDPDRAGQGGAQPNHEGHADRADREPVLAQRPEQPAVAHAHRDDGAEVAERQHRQLQPRQGRETGEGQHGDLQPKRRPLERSHCGCCGRECQRIRQCLRHRGRGVEELGQEHCESRGGQSQAIADAQAPREQEGRDRRQRHRHGVERLDRAIRMLDVVPEPGGSRQERIEQRQEVRALATDERCAALEQ